MDWHVWEVWDYSTIRPGRYTTKAEAQKEQAWWQEYYATQPILQQPTEVQIRECDYSCRRYGCGCDYKEAR